MSEHIIYGAIDTLDLDEGERLAGALARAGCGVKLGSAFLSAHGPAAVRKLCPDDVPLFLDMKYHDIPNTVAQAVRAACRSMRPRVMTVHAAGGGAMLEAAASAAAESPGDAMILAVTVLTSLDAGDLLQIGVVGEVGPQVRRLADLALASGCGGIVCAPHEVAELRSAAPKARLVVPGIRLSDSPADDQKRVMTPARAIAAGADDLVIGRPITQAADPEATARAILAEVGAAA